MTTPVTTRTPMQIKAITRNLFMYELIKRPLIGGSRLSWADGEITKTIINIPPIQLTVASKCSQSTIVAAIIAPVLIGSPPFFSPHCVPFLLYIKLFIEYCGCSHSNIAPPESFVNTSGCEDNRCFILRKVPVSHYRWKCYLCSQIKVLTMFQFEYGLYLNGVNQRLSQN